jgi:hypothetical protein
MATGGETTKSDLRTDHQSAGAGRVSRGWSVNAPAPDGGPSPARVLKTHLALIAIPVIVLFPAAPLS